MDVGDLEEVVFFGETGEGEKHEGERRHEEESGGRKEKPKHCETRAMSVIIIVLQLKL